MVERTETGLPEEVEGKDRSHALLTTSLRQKIVEGTEDLPSNQQRRFRQQVRDRLRDTILDFGLLRTAPAPLTSQLLEKADVDHPNFDSNLYGGLVSIIAVIYRALGRRPEVFMDILYEGILSVYGEVALFGNPDEFVADVNVEISPVTYEYEQLFEWYEKGVLEQKLDDPSAHELALLQLDNRGYDIAEIEE